MVSFSIKTGDQTDETERRNLVNKTELNIASYEFWEIFSSTKFTRKHLCQSLLFNKVADPLKLFPNST